MVNTTLVVEEDPNQLIRWTSCTPSVKLKKETGVPHARALTSPGRAEGVGVGVGVDTGADADADVDMAGFAIHEQ